MNQTPRFLRNTSVVNCPLIAKSSHIRTASPSARPRAPWSRRSSSRRPHRCPSMPNASSPSASAVRPLRRLHRAPPPCTSTITTVSTPIIIINIITTHNTPASAWTTAALKWPKSEYSNQFTTCDVVIRAVAITYSEWPGPSVRVYLSA